MARYTVKLKNAYAGGNNVNTYADLDEALFMFLEAHMDGYKVQLTADVPQDDEDDDDF